MAIAKLSIDLEAKLANLQAGLDKAGLLAERQAARIDSAFSGLKTVTAGLGAGLAAAFTIPALVTFLNRTAEGVDKLNDLKDASGASIENLSALEDIAARTGTSMDTAGDAVIKMNKALADAKPGSDQAEALKALGLSVEKLKQLDPVEAFQQIAIALQGFADDGNKARLTQELFGKSLRDVAPLLKDVAEAGKLNATVTTEQAEAAEKFRKEMFQLEKSVTDGARAIAGPMISAINALLGTMRAGAREGQPLWAALLGQSELLRIAGLTGGVTDYSERIAALNKLLAEGNLTQERRVRLEAQLAGLQAKAGEAGSRRAEDRGFIPTIDRPSLPDTIGGGDKGASKAGATRAAEDRRRLAEFSARQIVEIEEQAAEDTAAAWKAWEGQQIALAKSRADAEIEQWRQVFEFIDQQQEEAIAEGQALLDDPKIKKQLDEMSTFADQAGRNIQDALGNTVEATLSGNFESIGDLWKNLLIRMASEAAAARIGQELLGDFGKTGNIGGTIGQILTLFASANGNAFGAGVPVPFAKGGILGPLGGMLDRPTIFPMANGGIGIGGEAGTEAVMPLVRGKGGRLGVQSQGGGRQIVVNQTTVNNIDSRTDQAVVGQLVAAGVQEGQRQMLEHLRATGAI